ncbi:MAG: hypothetical protein V4719_03120 [Planctomycetota bacterium]
MRNRNRPHTADWLSYLFRDKYALVSCAIGVLIELYICQMSRSEEKRSIAAIVKDRLTAEFAEDLYELDAELFAEIKSFDALAPVITHRDDSLALRAAWERAVRRAEPQEASASRWQKLRYEVAAAEFLGFCEGRLRVSIPTHFAAMLKEADPKDPFGNVLNLKKYRPNRQSVERVEGIVSNIDTVIDLSKEESFALLTMNGEECKIPRSLLADDPKRGHINGVAAQISPDVVFVACFDNLGLSYKLTAIDRKLKTTIWETNVCSTAFGGGSGAGFLHHVKLVEANGRIYAFGATWDTIYIEAFNTRTGKAEMRFANRY